MDGWEDWDFSALVLLKALTEPSDCWWLEAMAVQERQRTRGQKMQKGATAAAIKAGHGVKWPHGPHDP